MRCFAWRAWAPGPKLQMTPVLTAIRVEMVKTGAIRKLHSRENSQSSSGDDLSRKTPGEQDSESKSRESGEPSGGGARVGARQNCEWCRF